MTDQLIKEIRQQNDAYRKTIGLSIQDVDWDNTPRGRCVMTQGFSSLDMFDKFEALNRLRNFNDFNYENDPYSEHDLGAFKVNQHDIIWKINYYSNDLEDGSEDPSNPDITIRVLTMMLANEY